MHKELARRHIVELEGHRQLCIPVCLDHRLQCDCYAGDCLRYQEWTLMDDDICIFLRKGSSFGNYYMLVLVSLSLG
jgi:hypothetical protein